MAKIEKPKGMSVYEFIYGQPKPKMNSVEKKPSKPEVLTRQTPRFDMDNIGLTSPKFKTDEERRQFFQDVYHDLCGDFQLQIKEVAYMIDYPKWFIRYAKYIVPDMFKNDDVDFLAEVVRTMRDNLFVGRDNDILGLSKQLLTKQAKVLYGEEMLEETFACLSNVELTDKDKETIPTIILEQACGLVVLRHLHNHPEAFVLVGVDTKAEVDMLLHDLPRMLEFLENFEEYDDLASRITTIVKKIDDPYNV